MLSLEVPVFVLFATLLSAPASAGGFEAKTMRSELAFNELERSLVIGRGWLEVGLGADIKRADGYWAPGGGFFNDPTAALPFEDASWLYTTERIDVRYGIARRAELYWRLPFHYVNLQNEALGTDTSGFGIGDPEFGYCYEWLRKNAPLASLITDLHFRMPTGSEAPGSYIGGPNTLSDFVFSTGTPDVGLYLRGKRQFGAFAVLGSVGYLRRMSGVTQFVVEVEENQFLGRFKPGDEIQATFGPMWQIARLNLAGEVRYEHRAVASAGATSGGLYKNWNLDPIVGSAGNAVDAAGTVTLNATRQIDLIAAVNVPIYGEDLAFWPLEELSPTRGTTWSGTLELRY